MMQLVYESVFLVTQTHESPRSFLQQMDALNCYTVSLGFCSVTGIRKIILNNLINNFKGNRYLGYTLDK